MKRLVFPILAATLLGACERNVIEQRAQMIRERNEKVDRTFSARALHEVRRRWLIEGDSWFGKLPDGTLVRLDSPTVTAQPEHSGKPFYSGWACEVRLSAVWFKAQPPRDFGRTFAMSYRVYFRDMKRCEIGVTAGPQISRPAREEVAALAQLTN